MSSGSGPSRIRLLDGGMGTTLESLGHDVSTPLWGCDLLQTNPDAIRDIHDGFLKAGSELIETATYQLTSRGLQDYAKVSQYEAEEIMRSAVHLAHSSITASSTKGEVVLALGPYGATLSPGQEYAGIYPPHFGPDIKPGQPLTNYIDYNHSSERRLAEFHYDRLLIFALDKETWDKVDYIAFETIPLLREIRAVRQAMWMLWDRDPEKVQVEKKKFWVSSAFPEGEHPQMDRYGERVEVRKVLEAMVGGWEYLPVPDAIGINCTNPRHLPELTKDFTKAMGKIQQRTEEIRPGFVIYPDGGCTYDVVTRKWTEGAADPQSWAKNLAGVAKGLAESGQWGDVIVGGCCKSGFEEISALRKELDR